MNEIKINLSPFCFLSLTIHSLFLFIAALISNFLVVEQLYSEPLIELTPENQFAFADSLFEQKNYPSATIEFKKFIFFFPEDERIEQVQFKIGLSLFYQKDYEKALNQFPSILDRYGPDEFGIHSGMFVSRCYIALNNYDAAVSNLLSLIKRTDDLGLRDEIYYLLGWTYVEFGNFLGAALTFEKIKHNEKMEHTAKSIVDEINEYRNIPTRSPALAGILSIFPGGGYLYCGRYRDALISLIVNSACAGAAYESFDKHLNVMGGIASVIGIGFYGGNIYGGISSAYKFNRTAAEEFIVNLKNNFNISLTSESESNGLIFTIHHRF